ncbi:MAG: DoxX family protein [Parachlamydia sp.]|nr:DoxX family protein [Parachlamydia sp.]
MSRFLDWLFHPRTDGHSAIILIRIFAGLVFLGEGILKFLYPSMGLKRFTLLGFPFPEATADFIGVIEIVGGICLLLGLLTNFWAIVFAIEMIVAFLSTKISLYYGVSPLPAPAVPPLAGFWAVVHESRSDYSQFLAMLFLLIAGPGKFSLDAFMFPSKRSIN